jgi:hypothetical protein
MNKISLIFAAFNEKNGVLLPTRSQFRLPIKLYCKTLGSLGIRRSLSPPTVENLTKTLVSLPISKTSWPCIFADVVCYGKCPKAPKSFAYTTLSECLPIEMRHFLVKNIVLQQKGREHQQIPSFT